MSGTRATQVIVGPSGAIPVPSPLTFAEIDAFNRCTGADLSIADIALIRRLDQQYVRIASGLPDPDAPKPTLGSMLRERARETRPKGDAQ